MYKKINFCMGCVVVLVFLSACATQPKESDISSTENNNSQDKIMTAVGYSLEQAKIDIDTDYLKQILGDKSNLQNPAILKKQHTD